MAWARSCIPSSGQGEWFLLLCTALWCTEQLLGDRGVTSALAPQGQLGRVGVALGSDSSHLADRADHRGVDPWWRLRPPERSCVLAAVLCSGPWDSKWKKPHPCPLVLLPS